MSKLRKIRKKFRVMITTSVLLSSVYPLFDFIFKERTVILFAGISLFVVQVILMSFAVYYLVIMNKEEKKEKAATQNELSDK